MTHLLAATLGTIPDVYSPALLLHAAGTTIIQEAPMWQTTFSPAFITALATFVTALTGLIVALRTHEKAATVASKVADVARDTATVARLTNGRFDELAAHVDALRAATTHPAPPAAPGDAAKAPPRP